MQALRIMARLLPLALAALMALTGCFSTRTESPAAAQFDSLGISLAGIRQANMRAAYTFSLAIEEAADSIVAAADDRETKIQAYLWKIYCIPVIRQVYSETDPVVASLDALAFAMQCKQYFDTGLGSDRFGEQQLIAIKATSKIEDALVESMRRNLTQANFDTLLTGVDSWVKDHPLDNHVFSRRSITREMDDILATQDRSLGSAIGRIADNVDDLSSRLALYSAQLPREARWQGELLLEELLIRERLATIDTTIGLLSASLAEIEGTLTEGGITVDITALRSLHTDIVAALELVRSERAILLAEVERQRLETLREVEVIVENRVVQASHEVEGIINRTLWKVGVLLALLIVGVALLLLLARALWKGRKEPSRPA